MADYKDGVVGSKSKNLAALRGKLPDWISLPASVTLPFGCFERALDAPENAPVKKTIVEAAAKVAKGSAAKHLAECRDAVNHKLAMPRELRKALAKEMEAAGLPLPESDERWAAAERAIIGVWASKFNDRAYYSMRKVGLNFMDLRMAVLVQRVVPARYAFVIHTNNPSTGVSSSLGGICLLF
jgi:alpha-glucan,water dikinase